MKRCPTCQRTYPDDAPGFCVNDGTQLVTEDAKAFDPQKTIMASAPPPPQYSSPAPPSSPVANQPQQQGQPAWAPPSPPGQQQPQNWGGGYYQQPGQAPGYPQQYAPPVAGGKGLSLSSFLIGLVSFLAVAVIFLMSERVIVPDRDLAAVCFYGSAALGLVSLVLGALALISRRQRKKWMAILGLVLGIPAILFFLYILINYGL
jgi:hypothetical protein